MQANFKPNAPIILPANQITSVNGTPTSIDVKATQHLWPHNRPIIEVANVQSSLFPPNRPCRIILDSNQMNIQVIVGIQDLFSAHPKISLIPIIAPSLAINRDIKLRSVQMSIVNFPRFIGSTDQWIKQGHNMSRQGVAVLSEHLWTIKIAALPNIDDVWKEVTSTNGRSATHTGSLERTDGKSFAAGDAYDLISSLRSFLSFVPDYSPSSAKVG